jgi:trk system potassium uptake protein
MNIIIAGDGEVGFHLAELLSDGSHNITVVDPHEDLLRKIEDQSDILAIDGDSTSPSVLRKAGVEEADLVIAVLHDEKTNILTAALSKKLGAQRTIARVDNPEYLTDESRAMFVQMGIDTIVCPERIASKEIIKLLNQPAATEIFDFSDGKLSLFLIKLDEKASVVGRTLDQIARENPQLDFRAIAIHRNSKTIIPRGQDMFHVNDLAYVITKPEGVEQLLHLSGKERMEIKSVMIAGGGRIARKTALLLENEKSVKLIERDLERCNQLAETLRKTMIINGDARSLDLLEEEGISRYDAFLALTNHSETNILTCLMARSYGVARTIALVENIDYIDISQRCRD